MVVPVTASMDIQVQIAPNLQLATAGWIAADMDRRKMLTEVTVASAIVFLVTRVLTAPLPSLVSPVQTATAMV